MTKAGESILRGAREALDYAKGEDHDGFVAHVPGQIDVRSIRQKAGLSQAKFASQFGFGLDAIRNWEQGRRKPDSSSRAFLMVIEREPKAVKRALAGATKKKPIRKSA